MEKKERATTQSGGMHEEVKNASISMRDTQKKRALNLLWDHGWTEDEIVAALDVPIKKIREWNDKRMKRWEA